jgi:hypothetical protein
MRLFVNPTGRGVYGLVPLQLYPPSDKMTRRHLNRSSHTFAICPNKLERH